MAKPKTSLPKWDDPNQSSMGSFLFPHARAVVTVQEVAVALRISENQVRALVDEGRITAFGIGSQDATVRQHMRIWRSSVEQFIAGQNPGNS